MPHGRAMAKATARALTARPQYTQPRPTLPFARDFLTSRSAAPAVTITHASSLYMPAPDLKGKGKAAASSSDATPGSAEDALHLLTLGSYVRQSSSGVYTFLGAGLSLLRSIEAVIDDEMHRIGAQRIEMPTLLSAAPWKKSGRLEAMGSELYKVTDRRGGAWVLAPTHEEEVTRLISADVHSYKDLPVKVYQLTRKHRDEPRPRLGLLRTREFVMKDLYTFDQDTEAALHSYEAVRAAYARVMQRLFGSQEQGGWRVAVADSGAMGGSRSHEFHVQDEAGEDDVVVCSSCDYAANVEVAQAGTGAASSSTAAQRSQPVAIMHDEEDLAVHLYTTAAPGHSLDQAALTAVVVPQDAAHQVDVDKLASHAEMQRVWPPAPVSTQHEQAAWPAWDWKERPEGPILGRFARLDVVLDARCGAVEGQDVEEAIRTALIQASDQRLADGISSTRSDVEELDGTPTLRDFFPSGASSWQYVEGVATSSVEPLTSSSSSSVCPSCEHGHLTTRKAIEVGHTFVLGDRYTRALGYQFAAPASEGGRQERRFAQMGCYGLGVTRLVGVLAIRARQAWLAARQGEVTPGLLWPRWLAPYTHAIVLADGGAAESQEVKALVEEVQQQASGSDGAPVRLLVEDRSSPGVGARLRDVDLLGVPHVWVVRRGQRGKGDEGAPQWRIVRER